MIRQFVPPKQAVCNDSGFPWELSPAIKAKLLNPLGALIYVYATYRGKFADFLGRTCYDAIAHFPCGELERLKVLMV